MENVKAIILAAGRGSRLKDKTKDKPKCLNLIKNKPLIEWQIEALEKSSISDIAIVTGYKSEMLEYLNKPLIHNKDWETTNMVMSLLCAEPYLNDINIISYSDILYGNKIITPLLKDKNKISLAYDTLWQKQWELRFADPLSDAETFKVDDAYKLTEIGQKTSSLSDVQGQYIGLVKFSKEAFLDLKEVLFNCNYDINKIDMTKWLSFAIHKNTDIYGVPVEGGWFEVDNEKDLALANENFDDLKI